ncbi:MAG: hypothetical protein N3B16_05140 [Candidatus Aminicenantes bacterium]|nr:hypothetical protein [Candidatus Aminicenantes bacterium]
MRQPRRGLICLVFLYGPLKAQRPKILGTGQLEDGIEDRTKFPGVSLTISKFWIKKVLPGFEIETKTIFVAARPVTGVTIVLRLAKIEREIISEKGDWLFK